LGLAGTLNGRSRLRYCSASEARRPIKGPEKKLGRLVWQLQANETGALVIMRYSGAGAWWRKVGGYL